MSGSGWEALPKVWVWSRCPPKGPEMVEKPAWRFGKGREALSEVQEWSGGPP